MRKRSIAVAVLVAAGLAVPMAGAAAAGEPGDEARDVIVICEDGEVVVREPTDEERERMRTERVPMERVRPPAPSRPGVPALPSGVVPAVPADPDAPPRVTCDADGPHPPRLERAEPARPR